MLVAGDHQVHRFTGINQLLSHGLQPLERPAIIGAHVGQHDQGIGLGHDLVVVVQHGLGQVCELQPFCGALEGDQRGLVGGQTDDAQVHLTIAQDDVGRRPGGMLPLGALKHDVGADPGEVGLRCACLQQILPLVELVVAVSGHVVLQHVVDVNGALAQQQLGDGCRTQVDVASIHQENVVLSDIIPDVVQHTSHVGRATTPTGVALQVAVEVVGVQDGEPCPRGVVLSDQG